MSPRFVLGRENVPCVAEIVNRSLKADCTDFTLVGFEIFIARARAKIFNFPPNLNRFFAAFSLGKIIDPLESCQNDQRPSKNVR